MERGVEDCFRGYGSNRSQPTYKEWKGVSALILLVPRSGSQPTYKEWKAQWLVRMLVRWLSVPSLPTRNGKVHLKSLASEHIQGVPSLPTRNGKHTTTLLPKGYTSLFPAYLQGMESGIIPFPGCVPQSSQPTYKEWKGFFKNFGGLIGNRSQPTYKEWKGASEGLLYLCGKPVPSLPTRNGKQFCAGLLQRRQGTFPAYLQGMERDFTMDRVLRRKISSQPTYKEWKGSERSQKREHLRNVPSLPTRNGNGTGRRDHGGRWPGFPAYLQGMETSVAEV